MEPGQLAAKRDSTGRANLSQNVPTLIETLRGKEHQFFNKDYIRVEKVLCTPTMYPLMHQSGMQQITNTWKDECLRVLDVLLHIQRDNCSFGLKFSAFDP